MSNTVVHRGNTARPPLLAVALLSAAALGYEVLLMRLFSIVQWHHFAYMVISLALLGYGASGTFLALLQSWLRDRFRLAFCVNIGLFAVSAMGCYLIAQQLPFNPEAVLWDIRQLLYLTVMYLLLMLPFFFAANAVGLVFMTYRAAITRAYAADLVGAGLGSLAVIVLLLLTFPLSALGFIAALGMMSLLAAVWQLRITPALELRLIVLGAAAGLIFVGHYAELNPSPYKALSQMLLINGTQVTTRLASPLGLLTVVESREIPIRHAPGVSLTAKQAPPEQVAVFTDSSGMTVINDGHAPSTAYDYLDNLTWTLPYYLFKPNSVLVLGAGGGGEVLQALQYDVPEIHAVELNPQMVRLVRQDYSRFTGGLYDHPGVHLHVAEARGFIAGSEKKYDLIQLPLLDSFATSSAGLYALNESYLYTVEALTTFIEHLTPSGYLAISRWVNLPPKDTLKLFATAVTALERIGIRNPGKQLILIRGWQTSTLLIKNGIVADAEVDALRRFATARAFDLCWFPGIRANDVNRFNLLDAPHFYNAARALLGPEREAFLKQYKFNIRPASDDAPYYFQFFKWRSLPEILELRSRGGMPLLEWGYLVLVATLIQAMVASAVLILLPLLMLRRRVRKRQSMTKRHVLLYFTAIGLAFLFIEIAFIQRFILFLHHPIYATAVVLTGFLIFAGLGSHYAKRLADNNRHSVGIWAAVATIAFIILIYLLTLGELFDWLGSWPIAAKILVTLLVIMPLAFSMGMPFPLVLDRLGRTAPELIPWAWGINGCASVISAVLATLVAIHFGFRIVILSALVLYLCAALALNTARAKTSTRGAHS